MTRRPGSISAGGETAVRDASVPRPHYERFSPGDILDDRYRIVALLGKGGMGEVYRADDMKLGQQVALKFLPAGALDQKAIERLYGEVRLGRRISHPNVCRLYDVGEWNGNHFVTMEYIDGEDLASLLRRIGQLPQHKAVELAQDICAGLAAAHGLGVVHRDLKPANIMIDGRGSAIITDFGLAALAEDLEQGSEMAGTPAYMAPEQLSGGTVTHKSDLYALGLILYEMFTGRRKFEGRSIDEMRRLHESSDPSTISRETGSIDPIIQQVVQRCLEPDPEERPRSIHSVIAALPGADPLQAAVDAGETPSPEMVAAAGTRGALSPALVVGLVALTMVLLLGVIAIKERTELYGVSALPHHPKVLEMRARELLELAGFADEAADSSYYLGINDDLATAPPEVLREIDPATTVPSPMVFYYRQSPQELIPLRGWRGDRRILPGDPPLTLPGMALVKLSPEGHLSRLLIIPTDQMMRSGPEPQWELLFAEAKVDFSTAREIEPPGPAPVDTDLRRSWELSDSDQSSRVVRVDAAALGGRVVWFDVVPSWRRASVTDNLTWASAEGSSPPDVVVTLVIITTLIFSLWFARRNLRRGRGDRRGAIRLGLGLFVAISFTLLLRADPAGPLPHVWSVAVELMGVALFRASTLTIIYLAIEPYLRRRWPTLLVSWSRFLAGRWRDPLVGRHVLIGVVAGMIFVLLELLPGVVGAELTVHLGGLHSTLTSARHALATSLNGVVSSLLPAFLLTAVMVGIAVVARRRLAGAAGIFILLCLVRALGALADHDLSVVRIASILIAVFLMIAVLYRLGLLAAIALWAMSHLHNHPLTLDTAAFFFPSSAITLAFIFGFLLWGAYASIETAPDTSAILRSSDSF